MTRTPPWIVAGGAALALGGLAACPGPQQGGTLPTPGFLALTIPDPAGANTWVGVPRTPPPAVLPTRGRAARVALTSPLGSTFDVGLRTPDGVRTPLPQNSGTPAPPEAGLFTIQSVDTSIDPPVYVVLVRAPAALSDPANYDVEIVNRSVNTNRRDSAPLVVSLRQRPDFSVAVTVTGDGHVESSPPGLRCGRSPSGAVLSPCRAEFPGGGLVRLSPGSNDLNTTRFVGWGGNCNPTMQVCELNLTGAAPMAATAVFGPSNVPAPPGACAAAPQLPGLRWIDLPSCATGNIDQHPGISLACDAQGWFCCEPGTGGNDPRCGPNKIRSDPDCRHHAPRGMLRQPGGCYEVAD